MRDWNPTQFDSLYDRFFCQEDDRYHFGGAAYYRRYRSRYKECVKRFASVAPNHPIDVLDIGGGQLALMCSALWKDRAAASDLPCPHLDYMAENGIKTLHWDICQQEAPFEDKFDFVFFSEVIEHLPIPGHIALERIRELMRPGATLLCTTPNLYRLRNLVYMLTARPIFENFQYGDGKHALGHILEYSAAHLSWQFKKAGFDRYRVETVEMNHLPTSPIYRPLAILGYPLHLIPHWRDNLVVTAITGA